MTIIKTHDQYYDNDLAVDLLTHYSKQRSPEGSAHDHLKYAQSIERGVNVNVARAFGDRCVSDISALDMKRAVITAMIRDTGSIKLRDQGEAETYIDLFLKPFEQLKQQYVPAYSLKTDVENVLQEGTIPDDLAQRMDVRSILKNIIHRERAAQSEMLNILATLPVNASIMGVVLHARGLSVWCCNWENVEFIGADEKTYQSVFVEYEFALSKVFFLSGLLREYPTLSNAFFTILNDALWSVEKQNSGVYAYSYDLLQKPVNVSTLYKVGRSKNVPQRIEQQSRQASKTVQIGDLVPMRFYPTNEPALYENAIHQALKDHGAHRQTAGSGSEWFETTLEQIDGVAMERGLLIFDPQNMKSYRPRRSNDGYIWIVDIADKGEKQ